MREGDTTASPVAYDSDIAAWEGGYIAVVPMRADEVDDAKLERWWARSLSRLPPWSRPHVPSKPSSPAGYGPKCPMLNSGADDLTEDAPEAVCVS